MAMKSNRHAKGVAHTLREVPESEELSSEEEVEIDATKFGSGKLVNDVERLKRQNLSMLRIPFDVRVSNPFRYSFAITACGIFAALFFFQVATSKEYVIYQGVVPFGLVNAVILLNSYGVNAFAFYCDVKELYHTLKYIVPVRNAWLPMVTLDRTEETNSLFVGPHAIPLSNLASINIFTRTFMLSCASGFMLGCFPWSLFTLILRSQYLQYGAMRIVVPVLGAMSISRAVLGPGFLVKGAFSMYYLFAYNMHTR